MAKVSHDEKYTRYSRFGLHGAPNATAVDGRIRARPETIDHGQRSQLPLRQRRRRGLTSPPPLVGVRIHVLTTALKEIHNRTTTAVDEARIDIHGGVDERNARGVVAIEQQSACGEAGGGVPEAMCAHEQLERVRLTAVLLGQRSTLERLFRCRRDESLELRQTRAARAD